MFQTVLDAVLGFLDTGLLHLSGWQILGAALLMTHITIAAVTIYLHRHSAHRALDLHPIVAHFFRFWLWMTTGMITKEWTAVHRKHHAKCETVDDPHSPQTRGIKKVFFEGAELYRAEADNKETIAKFGNGTPDDWVENNLYSRYQILGVSMMLIINVLLFGVAGMAVWALQMAWIPITAAGIINGFGHYWGYRNFNCEDASTNLIPWGILIGGEELHNNHHTYGSSAKLSNKWFEFDIGWMYIRILETFGLATVRKVAPMPKLEGPKMVADLHTLQAVIANRYDLMAKYARSLKETHDIERARLAACPNGSKIVDSGLFKAARKWLHRDVEQLNAPQREQLSEVFAHSGSLKTLYEMRTELAAIWQRSTASSEQLLHQLQDWCKRAEESGIQALQELSLRVRSYA
ncbi:fatty acid desaturase [Ampullimonas aquatilis]|uniref:DesA family fatty acid desaturase n=1 Tax=Ampullimonas aquatilis TaxID=1341549 RepID=UPI003C74696B